MDPDDAVLPAARHLLGNGARELLTVAVRSAGGRLRRCRSAQVLYRPGHDLVVRYDATVDWGDARPVEETLLACTTAAGLPAGTMELEADDLRVAVWRYPFDPDLPGLTTAVVPGAAAELLDPIVGATPTLTVRTFRPRHRAVVEVVGPGGRAFVKVVRPAEVEHLVAAHENLAAAGLPVPTVLAVDADEGLVVLEALPGDTLRTALGAGRRPWQPAPLLGLLDDVHAAAWPGAPSAEAGPLDHVAGHAELLAHVLPAERDRLARILDRLEPDRPDAGERASTVHGDLHEAQLLVAADGGVSGLLDLDDAGLGDPLDDVARLASHLSAMAIGRAQPVRRRIEALVAELRMHASADAGTALDRRIAAGLVAMATGPFRARVTGWQRASSLRLALAEHLVLGRENTLTRAS